MCVCYVRDCLYIYIYMCMYTYMSLEHIVPFVVLCASLLFVLVLCFTYSYEYLDHKVVHSFHNAVPDYFSNSFHLTLF